MPGMLPPRIVPGTVLAVHPHPRGELIWLADVEAGDTIRRIVFGGVPVVEPGHVVPVALPGAVVNGKKIRKRNYRGQASDGMLCSAFEAGLGTETDRVFILGRTDDGD